MAVGGGLSEWVGRRRKTSAERVTAKARRGPQQENAKTSAKVLSAMKPN
jgi:hypothetical protein